MAKKSEFAEKIPVYTKTGDLVEVKQPKVIMENFRGTSMLKIESSRDADAIFRQHPAFKADMEYREVFLIMLLNRQNQVIGMYTVSKGGRTGTVVDPSIIAFVAIGSLASGVILAHNHPSGSIEPSEADIRLTKKVKEGCLLLDITVLDHLIMTQEKYFSFADEGKM